MVAFDRSAAADPAIAKAIEVSEPYVTRIRRGDAQTRDTADPSIPAELTPTDPDIRELLHVGTESAEELAPESGRLRSKRPFE